MLIFLSKYLKYGFILFVSYTICFFGSKNTLSTIHEIVKAIFKNWFEWLMLHSIVIDLINCCYLNFLISFYCEYWSSFINCMINSPNLINFFCERVDLFIYLKEKNFGWWANNKRAVFIEKHLTQILICYFIQSEFTRCIWVNSKSFSLSVKNVNFVFIIVVEAFEWKIFSICLHFYFN